MKYTILLFLLLPNPGHAQSKVAGLGRYIIGVTTPDSLSRIDFVEQEQAYVKGTLTLPCTHIRSFKSGKVDVAGISIANLSLFFYDNKLFKLICDYGDELNATLLAKYGKGKPRPTRYVPLCVKKKGTPMVLGSEAWQNADIDALVIHSKGYNADCQMEEVTRLLIASKSISALASDCDLQTTVPLIEEFDKLLNDQPEQQSGSASGNAKKIKNSLE